MKWHKSEGSLDYNQYRGHQTSTYTDMFGIEYPLFEQSKIYYVTNIGRQRAEILKFLDKKFIEVLEETSMFKYIMIVVRDINEVRQLETELKVNFDCGLLWDGVM